MLIVIAFEWIALVKLMEWSKSAALYRLLPGALMLLALRSALVGADWPLVFVPLLLSFPAHLADLARTTQRKN